MAYDLDRLQRDIAQVQHPNAGFGSGRLIANNLILTAAHTLWDKKTGSGPFLGDWSARLEGDRGAESWAFLHGNRVVWHDRKLDLALILLMQPEGRAFLSRAALARCNYILEQSPPG
jgi:hypothetical protein